MDERNEILLSSNVFQYVRLVRLENPKIEIALEDNAPPNLAQSLSKTLFEISGTRWMVSVTQGGAKAEPTLAQQAQKRAEEERAQVLEMPIMKDILKVFPDAQLVAINKVTEG